MADVLLTRQSVILAETEGTYGSDPSPTAADNAILTTLPEFSFDVETYERNLARESLSPLDPRVTNINCSISFSCELKGAGLGGVGSDQFGAATNIPEIDPLLKACGFARSSQEGTDDWSGHYYKPSTATSCTIYFYQGQDTSNNAQLKKITGCIGNVSFSVEQGGIGLANFEFQGKYDGASTFLSSATLPTDADYQENLPPIAQNISFQYGTDGGFDISTFELNMNNEVQNIKTMNQDIKTATNFYLSGRAPSGSFNPIIENSATENVVQNLEGSTAKHIDFNLGSTDGNKVVFYLGATENSGSAVTTRSAATLTNVGFEDDNGVARYNCEFMLGASFDTGNDEILIVYR